MHVTDLAPFDHRAGTAAARYEGAFRMSIDQATLVDPGALPQYPVMLVETPVRAGTLYHLVFDEEVAPPLPPVGSQHSVLVPMYTGSTADMKTRYDNAASMHTAAHRKAYALANMSCSDFLTRYAAHYDHPAGSPSTLVEAEQQNINGLRELSLELAADPTPGNLARQAARAPLCPATQLLVDRLTDKHDINAITVGVTVVNTASAAAHVRTLCMTCPACRKRVATTPLGAVLHLYGCDRSTALITAEHVMAAARRVPGIIGVADGQAIAAFVAGGKLSKVDMQAALDQRYSSAHVKHMPPDCMLPLFLPDQVAAFVTRCTAEGKVISLSAAVLEKIGSDAGGRYMHAVANCVGPLVPITAVAIGDASPVDIARCVSRVIEAIGSVTPKRHVEAELSRRATAGQREALAAALIKAGRPDDAKRVLWWAHWRPAYDGLGKVKLAALIAKDPAVPPHACTAIMSIQASGRGNPIRIKRERREQSPFNRGLESLKRVMGSNGGNMPQAGATEIVEGGKPYPIGQWVKSVKKYYKKRTLDKEKAALLEKVAGWKWTARRGVDFPIVVDPSAGRSGRLPAPTVIYTAGPAPAHDSSMPMSDDEFELSGDDDFEALQPPPAAPAAPVAPARASRGVGRGIDRGVAVASSSASAAAVRPPFSAPKQPAAKPRAAKQPADRGGGRPRAAPGTNNRTCRCEFVPRVSRRAVPCRASCPRGSLVADR